MGTKKREKEKKCNSKKHIVLLHYGECNSILLLHSWEVELSIQHHATKINQLRWLPTLFNQTEKIQSLNHISDQQLFFGVIN